MQAVKEEFFGDIFPTPWGWVAVLRTVRGVRRVIPPQEDHRAATAALTRAHGGDWRERPWPAFRRAVREYLGGRRLIIDFPLDLSAPGSFTVSIRDATRRIPPGETITYGELARRAGCPRAARAAGQVMARNPVPLLIPCHRVVGAEGLGGFAFGRDLKRRLLELEAPRRGTSPTPSGGGKKKTTTRQRRRMEAIVCAR